MSKYGTAVLTLNIKEAKDVSEHHIFHFQGQGKNNIPCFSYLSWRIICINKYVLNSLAPTSELQSSFACFYFYVEYGKQRSREILFSEYLLCLKLMRMRMVSQRIQFDFSNIIKPIVFYCLPTTCRYVKRKIEANSRQQPSETMHIKAQMQKR